MEVKKFKISKERKVFCQLISFPERVLENNIETESSLVLFA